MASQLTAAVFAAAMAASKAKTESVSIPGAHLRRGSDATVTRDFSLVPGSHRVAAPVADVKAPARPLFQILGDASSSITPALLAKHHLPGILLQNGPLAIRHITAHLIASLPGFSTIPPAKQRRIVVGALEGRGGCSGVYGEVGGVDGNVIFEKVGWGRWDARRKGDPSRERVAAPISPPMSATRFRKGGLLSGYPGGGPEAHTSSYAESGIFVQSEEEGPHGEDAEMEDAMSLDESSSEQSDFDDMTDEEDWSQMGAAALRQHGGSPITSDGWGNSYAQSPSGFVQWKGLETPLQKRAREEREAVEALVKLSSI